MKPRCMFGTTAPSAILFVALLFGFFASTPLLAQGTAADYERANTLRTNKHNKDFDLLYIPGAGHGSGGAYGEHKRFDFFVRHLLGANPPAWTDANRKVTRTEQDEELP